MGGSLHKPPVGSLGNLPGQLAQLFLWSMDNFDKKMAEDERYQLVACQKLLPPLITLLQEEEEEPLMPPALAARRSPEEDTVANQHPVGNTANLPKWLVRQYLRLGWLVHPRVMIDEPSPGRLFNSCRPRLLISSSNRYFLKST